MRMMTGKGWRRGGLRERMDLFRVQDDADI